MKQTKKGFTLVELLVVIAILAILATVSVVGYTAFIQKAHESNDIQFLQSLNTLIIACDDINTPHDAFDFVRREGGVDLGKFHSKIEGCEILWDSHNEKFCYLNKEGELVYVPGTLPEGNLPANHELWMVCDTAEDANNCPYSIYYAGEDGATINTPNSFDGGWATGLTVNYTGTLEVAIIRMVDGAKLTISDTTDSHQQYFYGSVAHAEISTGNNCFHAHGDIDFVELKAGTFMQEEGTTTAIVMGANTTVNVIAGGSISKEYKAAEVAGKEEQIQIGATKFAGGMGTEENPYLIANAEHFVNIGTEYETYSYYKVAHGVETLDLAGIGRVNLNGSFNGNDATITNLDSVLFNYVGNGEDSQAVVLENFTVAFNAGQGIARTCITPSLTFKNINATGYIVTDWNAAVFLRYGSRNASDGFDYTVNFVNCASTTEVYSTANATSAILVGHPYSEDGTATINVDSFTNSAVESTILYYTGKGEAYGYKYHCASNANTVLIVDGVEVEGQGKITGENVIAVDSTKVAVKNNGIWAIDTEADVTKVVVKLTWQYTLWTNNYGEKIEAQAGVGGVIGEEIVIEVANGETVNVLDEITSVEIKTGADKWDYEIVDGKLVLYMTTDNTFVDGWVTLTVEQYTSGSAIAKYTGSTRIAEKVEDAAWTIK